LQGQLVNLENITEENELLEIRQELAAQGYIRREQTKNGRPQKIPPTRPERFVAPDGTEIFVGKNNVQNDHLTFSAMPEDIWLHTQNIPGSHVIIRMHRGKVFQGAAFLAGAGRLYPSPLCQKALRRQARFRPLYPSVYRLCRAAVLTARGKNDTIKTVSFIPRRFAAAALSRPGMRRGML
jgi:hypothetical protein